MGRWRYVEIWLNGEEPRPMVAHIMIGIESFYLEKVYKAIEIWNLLWI